MEKTVKTRAEIEEKYKWNLRKMVEEKSFDELYQGVIEKKDKIQSMQGHIMDSGTSLLTYLKMSDELDRALEQIYVYAHMLCDEDTANTEAQQLKMKTEKLNDDVNEALSFVRPEILNCSYDKVLEYIKTNKELEEYSFVLEAIFRYQKHTLGKKEEEIVAAASNAFGTGDDVFYNLDNADIYLGTIQDENGKEVELTNSNYGYYVGSNDRKVRENAFKAMYKYFGNLKNTIAASLKGQIKENFFYSKVRNYNSPLEMSLFHDNIDISVYYNLIDTIHNHLNSMYDYMKLRKQILGLDEIHMYDVYADLIQEKPKEIPFEEGKEIVLKALKPLGPEYIKDLEKAFIEKWIDVYPNRGKKSGAYSWGTYDSYPYLSLNYDNRIDSVSTMAHELGHSMHSYYSNKHQNFVNHGYPIFLAEIASTVNEVLLNDYLYKNVKSKEEKILYLTEFLDKVRTTIYRQTMFAEFEMLMHEKEANGVPLTEQEFSNTYYELNKLYYGSDVISDNEIRYEWARIPHFYDSFYVYKYATGLSSAIAIAYDIINGVEGAKEKYLEFLSSGGSDYPLEILKRAGVDMTTNEPIEKAITVFEQKLQELKSLYE